MVIKIKMGGISYGMEIQQVIFSNILFIWHQSRFALLLTPFSNRNLKQYLVKKRVLIELLHGLEDDTNNMGSKKLIKAQECFVFFSHTKITLKLIFLCFEKKNDQIHFDFVLQTILKIGQGLVLTIRIRFSSVKLNY